MVLLHAIANPIKPLRQTGGTSVAVIVGLGGLQNWPELISTFNTSLESNDKNSLEGALDALFKVRYAPPPLDGGLTDQCLLQTQDNLRLTGLLQNLEGQMSNLLVEANWNLPVNVSVKMLCVYTAAYVMLVNIPCPSLLEED